MSDLPNDIWRKILDHGVNTTKLTYKDLCSLSVTCQRLNELSGEDSLWSELLLSDFPESQELRFNPFIWWNPCFDPLLWDRPNEEPLLRDPLFSFCLLELFSTSPKSRYQIRFERDRERVKEVERRRLEYKRWHLEQQRRFDALFREYLPLQATPVPGVQLILEQENSRDLLSFLAKADEEGMAVKLKQKRKAIGGHLCYLRKKFSQVSSIRINRDQDTIFSFLIKPYWFYASPRVESNLSGQRSTEIIISDLELAMFFAETSVGWV
ncbi:hypothetical protein ACFE04_025336 [Oxalis oulophora]